MRVDSVEPNEAVAGELVTVFGENLASTIVRFDSLDVAAVAFDDGDRSFLQVRVPEGIAGESTVQVPDGEGSFQGNVPFRAPPVIDFVDEAIVATAEDGVATVYVVGAHFGDSAEVVWDGVRGGEILEVSHEECPPRRAGAGAAVLR